MYICDYDLATHTVFKTVFRYLCWFNLQVDIVQKFKEMQAEMTKLADGLLPALKLTGVKYLAVKSM